MVKKCETRVLLLVANGVSLFVHVFQAPNITSTFYRFERQLSNVYSRPVYHEFRRRLKSSTAFYIEQDPDPSKRGYFLLSLVQEPSDFPWLQHKYSVKVIVNKEKPEDSVFSCECMSLTHKGMAPNPTPDNEKNIISNFQKSRSC